MSVGIQTYEDLKKSDVEWIGEVPNHWELLPARTAVNNLTEKNEGALNQNYLSLVAGQGVIPYADKGDMGNKKPDDLSKCKLVKAGNLVINSMNYFIGSYGMSSYDGVCSPVYIVLDVQKNRIEPRFALRVFANNGFQKYLATFGNGILEHRAAIGWDDIKGAYLPIPPIKEQKQIAAFLDYETAKIDALIEKQQQLIALLGEKRQAVISHAVTKGLNSDAPMRDSGVEWLGEVPAHWVVKRLKHISPSVTVGVVVNPSTYVTKQGLPFIHGGDIREGKINSKDARKISIANSKRNSKTELQEGDVLMVRVGAGSGTTAVVPPECSGGNCASVMLVRRGDFNSDWLCFAMNNKIIQSQLEVVQYGAAQPQFNISHAVEFWFPCPEREEQNSIGRYLLENDDRFRELIEKAETTINLLTERRTALISAAVTGKIDVRNWKPPTDDKPQKNNKEAA